MPEKKLYEMQPGELSGKGREVMQPFIDNEVKRQCQLFDLSDDPNHLWRAWRTARAAGDLSPFCVEWLAPRLDQLASLPANETGAERREQRSTRLLDYYHELSLMHEQRPGCAESEAEVRRRVADRHGTTNGAINQMVMKFEGRGQRGEDSGGGL